MKGRTFAERLASVSLYKGSETAPESVPLGGTRAQAMQRLQIGLFGVAAMVLLVGLANIIGTQADLAEKGAVPEAAPTTEPTVAPQQTDPLADAGIVPDIPAEPAPIATPSTGQARPQSEQTRPNDPASPADVAPQR